MNCKCDICKNNKSFNLPNEIVEATIKGNLVLFCGAGISTEGKNVLPVSFYELIKNELNLDGKYHFCELMQQYCQRPNGRKKLLNKIRERFQYIHSFPELERQATRFHDELSSIYLIRTIITTNWDTYFEEHCGAIPIVIPEDFAFWDELSRFVIKIHGSINNLSSIVATSDDYEKCYDKLQNGIIGATLKNILCTKTIVFIGFSFGDNDFSRIMNYLRDEMEGLYPHIYIVTLDENINKRIKYDKCTIIITSGTNFLHQLKKILISKSLIVNSYDVVSVDNALNMVKDWHEKVSNIDLNKYPCVAYTLAYQDGVIHALERFIGNNKTGDYNRPGYVSNIIREYKKCVEQCYENENYWDMSYYEGYINGLVLIEAFGENLSVINDFPFLFLPSAKNVLASFDIYIKELKQVTNLNDKFNRYAKKILKGKVEKGIVVHHPPF